METGGGGESGGYKGRKDAHKRVEPSADRSAKKSLCPVITTMQRERLKL